MSFEQLKLAPLMHPMLGRLQVHEIRPGMMRKHGDSQYRIKCGAFHLMSVCQLTTHNLLDSCDGPIIFDCFLCTRCGAEMCHRCHDNARLSSTVPPACVANSKVREAPSRSLLSKLNHVHPRGMNTVHSPDFSLEKSMGLLPRSIRPCYMLPDH